MWHTQRFTIQFKYEELGFAFGIAGKISMNKV
jgi:hypothetical protein